MLFKPELAAKILASEKTQTRRMVKSDDKGWYRHDNLEKMDCVVRNTTVQWMVNRDYAVCPGRGKYQVGRIRVTALRKECVQDITDTDAVREGFANRQQFLDVFRKINPKSQLTDAVWVIDFELVR